MLCNRKSLLSVIFLLSSIACIASAAEDDRFSFAVWGDMPYARSGDHPKISGLINDINQSNVDFSIFDGDIKDGGSICSDSQYYEAIKRFNSFKKPMIYLPGDNEWTDCHRTNNGGYNNVERLAFIRQIMINTPNSFGQKKLTLEHQGQLGGLYAENVRWQRGNVIFLGLNIPGSNNNKVSSNAECVNNSSRTSADCADDNAEYIARDVANIKYLKYTFQLAKDKSAKGIFITIQADMGFDLPETEVNERTLPNYDGYTNFINALIIETNNFKGDVVLAHGDTHFFKIDKPLLDQSHLIKNFTRLETFGSPNIHWVKVTVNPSNRNLFTFEPMMVKGN